jgi:hypothetical protein
MRRGALVTESPIFNQPARVEPVLEIPMTDLGREIAARVKETFYAYGNRPSSDNRSAQVHLGPSEIGTPCDRRLAMSLLRIPAVNTGGDGWAAFVGTCVHAGLAEMFMWADAGSGRYSVETPLEFPSVLVPRGTGDLLDRVLCVFVDHKAMGKWSLNKLRTQGPSLTYRVQVHTYAYGAKRRGEKIRHVAIIAWPREGSTLDDLYVWTEPYDRTVAEKALKRVERIARDLPENCPPGEAALRAAQFDTAADCSYCPHHLSGSKDLKHGCSGPK